MIDKGLAAASAVGKETDKTLMSKGKRYAAGTGAQEGSEDEVEDKDEGEVENKNEAGNDNDMQNENDVDNENEVRSIFEASVDPYQQSCLGK